MYVLFIKILNILRFIYLLIYLINYILNLKFNIYSQLKFNHLVNSHL